MTRKDIAKIEKSITSALVYTYKAQGRADTNGQRDEINRLVIQLLVAREKAWSILASIPPWED